MHTKKTAKEKTLCGETEIHMCVYGRLFEIHWEIDVQSAPIKPTEVHSKEKRIPTSNI